MTARSVKVRQVRHGSISVFMVVVILAIVTVIALVFDLGRIHTGYAELQTEADAASLRGAAFLQGNPGTDPTPVVLNFDTTSNWVLGDSLSVSRADVSGVFWDPDATPKAVPRAWVDGANAVQVRAGKNRGLLFGQLLALSPTVATPRGIAIAWVANVISIRCPVPWGFPMRALNSALYGSADDVVRGDYFNRLATYLVSPGPLALTMVLYADGNSAPAGAWNFGAIGETPNMSEYPEQIASANTSCSADVSATVNETEVFPGGAAVPQKTVRGVFGHNSLQTTGSLCEPKPANVADCFPTGSARVGPAGVTVPVSWIEQPAPSGNNAKQADVLTIGGFRVMCVFGGPNGPGGPAQTCGWYTQLRAIRPSLPATPPQGTIIGYPVNVTPGLGPGTALGNNPTMGKRLVLVR